MGKIPCEWSVSKLKWYLRRIDPRNPGDKQVLSLYREYGVIPKDSRDDNHNATSEDTSKYKYVRVGDFVVNKMKAWQGSVAVSEYDGIVSPAYYVYHFTDDSYHRRYFHYLLRSCYKEEFMRLSGGIRVGQWDLSSKDLDNVLIVIPKKEEQQAIADYLDETCSKIDEIIAEAKASIDEYKELKQSTLCDAVLRGLNSQVVLKNSGASWIGMIPEHWQTAKLKWHLRRIDPKNPGEKEVLSLYRDYGVIPKNSRTDNHNVTSEDTSKYKYVRIGDFVVNKMKAWQGSVAVSDYEGIVSPAYYVYHFLDDVFNKRYFHHLLRSCYKEEFMRLSGGIRTGQWDLSSNNLDNIILLVPPKNEQDNIVEYLDNRLPQIDSLIAEKESLINDLEAYKKSLIYEVVTGKRRVV